MTMIWILPRPASPECHRLCGPLRWGAGQHDGVNVVLGCHSSLKMQWIWSFLGGKPRLEDWLKRPLSPTVEQGPRANDRRDSFERVVAVESAGAGARRATPPCRPGHPRLRGSSADVDFTGLTPV